MEDRDEFKCPECGSSQFGSSVNPDGSYTRHCHGYKRRAGAFGFTACSFRWHQDDDEDYGLKPPKQEVGVGQE